MLETKILKRFLCSTQKSALEPTSKAFHALSRGCPGAEKRCRNDVATAIAHRPVPTQCLWTSGVSSEHPLEQGKIKINIKIKLAMLCSGLCFCFFNLGPAVSRCRLRFEQGMCHGRCERTQRRSDTSPVGSFETFAAICSNDRYARRPFPSI